MMRWCWREHSWQASARGRRARPAGWGWCQQHLVHRVAEPHGRDVAAPGDRGGAMDVDDGGERVGGGMSHMMGVGAERAPGARGGSKQQAATLYPVTAVSTRSAHGQHTVSTRRQAATLYPVMTSASEGASLLDGVNTCTVVSSVLGSALAKMHAIVSSLSLPATALMAASTAGDANRRCAGGGRRSRHAGGAAPHAGAPPAPPVVDAHTHTHANAMLMIVAAAAVEPRTLVLVRRGGCMVCGGAMAGVGGSVDAGTDHAR